MFQGPSNKIDLGVDSLLSNAMAESAKSKDKIIGSTDRPMHYIAGAIFLATAAVCARLDAMALMYEGQLRNDKQDKQDDPEQPGNGSKIHTE